MSDIREYKSTHGTKYYIMDDENVYKTPLLSMSYPVKAFDGGVCTLSIKLDDSKECEEMKTHLIEKCDQFKKLLKKLRVSKKSIDKFDGFIITHEKYGDSMKCKIPVKQDQYCSRFVDSENKHLNLTPKNITVECRNYNSARIAYKLNEFFVNKSGVVYCTPVAVKVKFVTKEKEEQEKEDVILPDYDEEL